MRLKKSLYVLASAMLMASLVTSCGKEPEEAKAPAQTTTPTPSHTSARPARSNSKVSPNRHRGRILVTDLLKREPIAMGAQNSRLLTWMLLTVAALCPGCVCDDRDAIKEAMQTPRQGEGRPRLEVVEDIPVLHLYGTGDQMAHQYGELLRPALQALDRYVGAILPPGLRRCYTARSLEAEAALPEEVRRHIRIASEAAEVPYEHLLALNVVPRFECSALAVWGPVTEDGEVIMGRNAEYFGLGLSDRGSLIVVRHATDRTPSVLVGFLGMLGGFTGITAEGVAFGNMVIFNPHYRENRWETNGLPVQLAMPLAADGCRSADEVVARLRKMDHAIPMNVMVADRQRALVLEIGPAGGVLVEGREGALATSNFYTVYPNRSYDYACPRSKALLATADAFRGSMAADQMEAALAAGSFDPFNLHAVVFEPGAMRMRVSLNRVPAADGPYQAFDLRELLAD